MHYYGLMERYCQGQLESTRKYLPQCYFVHHKSHTDWPDNKTGPPRCETGDWPPKPWQAPLSVKFTEKIIALLLPLTYLLNTPVTYLQSIFQKGVRNINAKPSVDFDTPQTTRRICPWYTQNTNHSPPQSGTTSEDIRVRSQWRRSSENELTSYSWDWQWCLSDYRFVFIPADISITATTAATSRTSSIALRTSSSTPVRHSAGSTRPTSNFFCILFFRVNETSHKAIFKNSILFYCSTDYALLHYLTRYMKQVLYELPFCKFPAFNAIWRFIYKNPITKALRKIS
jgi:hypothetical protein